MPNDPELEKYIPNKELGNTPQISEADNMTYFKAMLPNITTVNKTVLGVLWDTTSDEFVFRFGNNLLRKIRKHNDLIMENV